MTHLSNWGIDCTCGHITAQFITLGNFFNFCVSRAEQSLSQCLELGLLHHQWRSPHLLADGRNTWWICTAFSPGDDKLLPTTPAGMTGASSPQKGSFSVRTSKHGSNNKPQMGRNQITSGQTGHIWQRETEIRGPWPPPWLQGMRWAWGCTELSRCGRISAPRVAGSWVGDG